jgi:hypothetical protein
MNNLSWLSKDYQQHSANTTTNTNTTNNNVDYKQNMYTYTNPPAETGLSFQPTELYRGIRHNNNADTTVSNPFNAATFPTTTIGNTKDLTLPNLSQQSKTLTSVSDKGNWLGISTTVVTTDSLQILSSPLPEPPVFIEQNFSFYPSCNYKESITTLTSLFNSTDFDCDFNYDSSKHRMKCCCYQSCSTVTFNIYFYAINNKTNNSNAELLVEFQRRSGDSLQFYSFYSKLINKLRELNKINENITKSTNTPLTSLPPSTINNVHANNNSSSFEPPELNDSNIEADDNLIALLFSMLCSSYLESKRNALTGYSLLFQSSPKNTVKCLSQQENELLPILSQLLQSNDMDLSRNAAKLLAIISCEMNNNDGLLIDALSNTGLLAQSIDIIDSPAIDSTIYVDKTANINNAMNCDPLFQRDTKRLLCELLCNITAKQDCAQQVRNHLSINNTDNDNTNIIPLFETLLDVLARYSHVADQRLAKLCNKTKQQLQNTVPRASK